MIKLETVKGIGKLIVGIGVTSIVDNVVKANASEEDGKIKKFCIWTGTLVLGAMIADKACNYFGNSVDKIAKGAKEAVEESEKKED